MLFYVYIFPYRKCSISNIDIEFFIYVWKQCLFCCNFVSHFRSGLGLTWAGLQSRFRSRIRCSRSMSSFYLDWNLMTIVYMEVINKACFLVYCPLDIPTTSPVGSTEVRADIRIDVQTDWDLCWGSFL